MSAFVTPAAGGAALLLVVLSLLHAALALGLPLGAYAWGGRHEGVLPPRLQLGSALSVPILFAMAMIVLIRAGLLYPHWAPAMEWPVWGIFLFLAASGFGNLSSASRRERLVTAPVTALAAVLVCVVAMN